MFLLWQWLLFPVFDGDVLFRLDSVSEASSSFRTIIRAGAKIFLFLH